MAARVTLLASGSRGNCAVLSSSTTRLLLDAGLSCRETLKRMKAAGEDPEGLDGILISHEHSDHVAGLPVLARKLKAPVYMTAATHAVWWKQYRSGREDAKPLERLECFASGRSFQVGDIQVTPFTIPHDAADPVGFTFRVEGTKLGFVTDLGYMPANVRHHLKGCDGLVVESNHDVEMLRAGPYPWSVKQRVMSRVGHLSNEALAEFFSGDYDGGAAFLILAHLSEQNNHPEIARGAAEQALGPRRNLLSNRLLLAGQDQALDPIWL
ncbi:MAG: MBL fold metallo-hydrolase [Terriglobales bacterium]